MAISTIAALLVIVVPATIGLAICYHHWYLTIIKLHGGGTASSRTNSNRFSNLLTKLVDATLQKVAGFKSLTGFLRCLNVSTAVTSISWVSVLAPAPITAFFEADVPAGVRPWTPADRTQDPAYFNLGEGASVAQPFNQPLLQDIAGVSKDELEKDDPASEKRSPDCDIGKVVGIGTGNDIPLQTSRLVKRESLQRDRGEGEGHKVKAAKLSGAALDSTSTCLKGDSFRARKVGKDRAYKADNPGRTDTLSSLIVLLPNPAGRVKFDGLIHCASDYFNKGDCSGIDVLGEGSGSLVFKLDFEEFEVAASIPLCHPEEFNPSAKLSEISTMFFIAESGSYPRVPVPKVYTWDLTYTNIAGTPYVFMEVIHGRQLSNVVKVVDGCTLTGLDALDAKDQMAVTRSLAQLHADISVPVDDHLNCIGGLTSKDPKKGDFTIGPLFSISGREIGGPFPSLSRYWCTFLDNEILHALESWDRRESDQLADYFNEPQGTPQDFASALQHLSLLIPWFIPPEPQQTLVLQHRDLALRNIIFDENDYTKIVGVLDWSGAAIAPLLLSGKFPDDLSSTESDPIRRHEVPPVQEAWATVPYDWTCLGKPSSWPGAMGLGGNSVNLSRIGSAMVRRYYLRQLFASHYALQFKDDMARASLFYDAPYYLKFDEVISGGWRSWLEHRRWISETSYRIRWKLNGYNNASVIVGPNTYTNEIGREPLILDLGVLPSTTGDDTDDDATSGSEEDSDED